MSRTRTPTHRAEGAPVLLKGSRLAPRTAAVVGGALAATAIVGAGGATAQADEATWDRVAQCESSGRWSVNTGNGYYGGLQFSRSTWNEFGGQAYAATADKASKDQQIAVARRVLASQGPGAWPVCSKKAGLTKTTGDADRSAQPGSGSSGTKAPADPAPSTPTSSSTKLVVDGRFGPATTRALQSWVGVTADGSLSTSDIKALQRKVGANPDGVIGRETTRKLQQSIGASTNGAKSFRTDRTTVRALQQYLNGHASSPSSSSGTKAPSNPAPSTTAKLAVDGSFGPKTARALQSWVGVTADGSLSTSDIKALQRKVGANPDGVIGRETTRKLQQSIGASTNGVKNFRTDRATVRVLQDYLNRR